MMEEAGRAVAGGDADVVGGHRHHAHGRRLLPRRALPLALRQGELTSFTALFTAFKCGR
jgi:hypothetical protein